MVTNARNGDLELTIDNPAGYFESTLLREFNDKVLELAGYSWDRPPLGRMHWCQGRFLLEAVRIKSQFRGYAANRDWVDKDPRLSITYPLYSHILLERRPVAISLRDPLEVAGSLYLRDGFSIEKGLLIWFMYNRSCADFLSPETDLVVNYNRLLEADQNELENIGKFLIGSKYSLACKSSDISARLSGAHKDCSVRSLKRQSPGNMRLDNRHTRLVKYCVDVYRSIRNAECTISQYKSIFREVPYWIVDSYHKVFSEGQPSLEYHRVLESKGISVECTSGNKDIDEELIATYSDLILSIHELKKSLPGDLGNESISRAADCKELDLAKERLAAMESSTSWRITAPLRSIMQRLKRVES